MDIKPDLRKTRRLKGTVSYRVRNYFALGVIAVGAVTGVLFHYSSGAQKFQQDIRNGRFERSEEELRHRALMNLESPYTVPSTRLKEILEAQEKDTVI